MGYQIGNKPETKRGKLCLSVHLWKLSDVADTQTIFRIIQSVPSEKAEPFKQWMARDASERIDEIQDPELAILRVPIGHVPSRLMM